MELAFLICIFFLTAAGAYLMLRPRMFSVILGLSLLGHAANLLILLMGRLVLNQPPILSETAKVYTDPLSQAFILTAIVIGFAMTALMLVMAFRGGEEANSDQVDGGYDAISK